MPICGCQNSITALRRPRWCLSGKSDHQPDILDLFVLEPFLHFLRVGQRQFPFAERCFAEHRRPTAGVAGARADDAVASRRAAADGAHVVLQRAPRQF